MPLERLDVSLHGEALAAAALGCGVGILEGEHGVEALRYIVDYRAAHQRPVGVLNEHCHVVERELLSCRRVAFGAGGAGLGEAWRLCRRNTQLECHRFEAMSP